MLTGRGDIIGDLARLRLDFVGAADRAEELLADLEVLAAAAVELGMSSNIVGRASGIPTQRIDAVIDARPTRVKQCSSTYESRPTGAVIRRDR